MRAMSASDLLNASGKFRGLRFWPDVDGYFLPESPAKIFASGQQAHVPLLLGWNSEEMNYHALMGKYKPTPENFEKVIKSAYGKNAGDVLDEFPHNTVKRSHSFSNSNRR